MIPLSYNLRNLAVRRTTTLLSALGIALVTTIFAAVLALAEGFRTAQVGMGDPGTIVITRQGSTSAINSSITREQARAIAAMPEIGAPEDFSTELAVIFQLKTVAGGDANVLVRGVSPSAFRAHPSVRLVAGRSIDPAKHEILVGRAAASRYAGLGIGRVIRQAGVDWTVVGIFTSAGSGFESEIWADIERAMEAFDRSEYSLVVTRLREASLFDAFAARVRADRRLQLVAVTEPRYYANQATGMTTLLRGLGIFVTSILAIGAVFGAVNTMYASVGARTAEIATLRALGFRRRDILFALLFEAAAIGLLGGLLGCLFALPVNGLSGAVLNFQSFSDMAFKFRLTPSIALYSILWAAAMGALGGFFPAIRAVRLPVAAAFRDVA